MTASLPSTKHPVRLPAVLVPVAVAVCVALAFRGALDAGFIFLDDGPMVTKNPFVRMGFGLDGVRWAITGVWGANWMPLTWLSHQLDWSLFRDEPRGHHLVSLVLHAVTCGLLVPTLRALGVSRVSSIVVTLLFALHPLRAESVVWIAERKDVLSALFATVVWWCFARARTAGRVVDAGLLVALVAGLCSKSMVVTVPAVLVLLEAWRTQRVPPWSFVKQLWPTVIPVVVTSIIVAKAQAGTAAVEQLSLVQRLGTAIVAVAQYLRLTVWPTSLSVFHPARASGPDLGEVVAASLLLLAITAAALVLWRRRVRAPLVGWLWFLGMLVPVSGVFPLGAHAFAERYTHLPHIGLFFGIVVGGEELLRCSRRARHAAVVLVVVALAAEVVVLQDVVSTWRSSSALAAAGLRTDPDNPVLLPVGAEAFSTTGAAGTAIERYEHAIAARRVYLATSRIDQAWAQLGLALLAVPAEVPRGLRVLREAVRLGPRNGLARRGLSVALFRSGARSDGVREAGVAVELMPDDATQRLNLASLLLSSGQAAEALSSLQSAPRHLQRDLAATTMRAAFLGGGCRLAAAKGETLSTLSAPTPAFVAERALALACTNDPRAPALLEQLTSTTPTRAGALAMIIAGLRDGADVSPLVGVVAAAPVEPGFENERLGVALQAPVQLAAVLAVLEPAPVRP